MHNFFLHSVPRFLEIIDRKCCILSGPPCICNMSCELESKCEVKDSYQFSSVLEINLNYFCPASKYFNSKSRNVGYILD